jgi:hypothetical protein
MPSGVYKKTEEHKRKISIGNTGKKHPHTQETKDKISKGGLGKTMSEEFRIKNSQRMIGKKYAKGYRHTKNAIEKIRKSSLGRRMSEEQKIKLSILHGGNGLLNKEYSVDWTATLRRSIRERDNYTCKMCNKQQGDRCHAVHHIDYNKYNCNPTNLITLCDCCHAKTNLKREMWIKYFKNIIN